MVKLRFNISFSLFFPLKYSHERVIDELHAYNYEDFHSLGD